MSGMLGQILGNVLGGQSAGQPSAVAAVLQQVVAGSGGASGLTALISRFQGAGLGSQVQSWVGTGANQPISTTDVARVFTPAEIEGWAQQAGTTPDAMRTVLAEALPRAIDHTTPSGQVPTQSADIGGLLAQFLGGATRHA